MRKIAYVIDPAGETPSPTLSVRPFCNNKDYWQVYFDTNMLIKDSFTTAGLSVPEQHYMFRATTTGTAMVAHS